MFFIKCLSLNLVTNKCEKLLVKVHFTNVYTSMDKEKLNVEVQCVISTLLFYPHFVCHSVMSQCLFPCFGCLRP